MNLSSEQRRLRNRIREAIDKINKDSITREEIEEVLEEEVQVVGYFSEEEYVHLEGLEEPK